MCARVEAVALGAVESASWHRRVGIAPASQLRARVYPLAGCKGPERGEDVAQEGPYQGQISHPDCD